MEKASKKEFVERELNDNVQGDYDEDGFFVTPNGSFWDPDEVYFNREGFDRHGGYYDDNGQYIPGEGWDDYNNCYFDEDPADDYADDMGDEGNIDDMYGNINEDDIFDETNLMVNNEQIEKINVDSEEVAQMEEYEKNQQAYNNQWKDGQYNYQEQKPTTNNKPKEEPKKAEENKPKEEEKKVENKPEVKHCSGLDALFADNSDPKKDTKSKKVTQGNKTKKNNPAPKKNK